jgi:8-oxo-dGTP pyrophosphatase MutT (NUDIX family)
MRLIPSARALLIDPDDRVLMMKLAGRRIVDPAARLRPTFWVTPGGSLEAGESFQDGLRRELREETGLEIADVGRHVWISDKELDISGERVLTRAHVYALRVPAFEPVVREMTPEETESFRGFRWWSLADIVASRESFIPRDLAALLRPLLAGDWPVEAIRIVS